MSKVTISQAASTLIPKYIGTEFDKVVTVANDIDAVVTVANAIESGELDKLEDVVDEITIVAADIASVVTVANDIDSVVNTAANIPAITNTSDNMLDVVKVSQNMSHVQNVSNNSQNVTTVSTNIADVTAVATNMVDVVTVAGMESDLDTIIANTDDIHTVVVNMPTIDTVATNIADIVTVGDNIANVSTVATNMGDVTTTSNNITDIDTVSTNIEYVIDVAEGLHGMPSTVFSGPLPPTVTPVPEGSTWFCTENGRTYIWYQDVDSAQWVESTPQSTLSDIEGGTVYDGIRDGVTGSAPSENAVFDALTGKSPVGHTHTPGEVGAAPVVHGHAIADVSGLQSALDGKAATVHTHTPEEAGAAPVNHTHTAAAVGAVSTAGDTMSGPLTLPKALLSTAQASEANAVTRKDWVEAAIAEAIAGVGGGGSGGSSTYTGDTAPIGAEVGSSWFCTLNGLTYLLYQDGDSTQWVESNPNYPVATGYITPEDIGALPLTGGTVTGPISGVPPTVAAHLATKEYVDLGLLAKAELSRVQSLEAQVQQLRTEIGLLKGLAL